MVQRTKVLDTEGTTPRFLYSMIKQLDLKLIDWNKVAHELEISNGHAARMRYSRFRSQMEGPKTTQRAVRKKNKKGAKGDMDFNMSPQMHLGIIPKTESLDSIQQQSSFMKCEYGNRKLSNSQIKSEVSELFQIPPMETSSGMPCSYMPPYTHQNMSVLEPGIMSPESAVPGTNFPIFGAPYSPYTHLQDLNVHDASMNFSSFNEIPVAIWEPRTFAESQQPSPRPPHIKIEDETEIMSIREDSAPDSTIKQETLKAEETKAPGA